jgi:hypothetical protein
MDPDLLFEQRLSDIVLTRPDDGEPNVVRLVSGIREIIGATCGPT